MLRAAVIGVGSMGANHARIYNELEEADLVAVADVREEVARRVGRVYSARPYTDYRCLLEKERPDIVSVAVPTKEHFAVAVDALEAGAYVLVEKPLAATVEEGKQLVKRAHALGRHLMVGHIERFNPAVAELKARIDAGCCGTLLEIHTRRLGPFPSRIRDVGVIVDLATHDLDIMRYLTGSEVLRLYAETGSHIHTCEDVLSGLVRFANGVLGVLDVSWLIPTKIRELYAVGEQGMFRVDYVTQDLYFYENGFSDSQWGSPGTLWGVAEGQMIRLCIRKQEPLRVELASFVQSVLEDRPPLVRGEDGLAALELAQYLRLSGQSQEVVRLKRLQEPAGVYPT